MPDLEEGDKVWDEQAEGSQRPGISVGVAEMSWFGGAPSAYVAYPDDRSGEAVEMMRIVPREEDTG